MTDQTRELERLSKHNDELMREMRSNESIDGNNSITNQSGGAAAFFNMFDATNTSLTQNASSVAADGVSPSSLVGAGKRFDTL